MVDHDSRDLGDNLVLEARRSDEASAGGPGPSRPTRPSAAPVALLERPEQPAAERPAKPVERPAESGPQSAPGEKARRFPRAVAATFGLILLAPTGAAGYVYWEDAGHFQSTDDAFIASRQFSIAPKVSGYVVTVPVTDNQHVAKGDVIARVDDRDYRVALAQAEAQVAAAEGAIRNIDAQLAAQQAQVGRVKAQVDQAQAALVFAGQQATRYQDLVQRGAGTVQNAQQYGSGLRQQEAAVKTAEAAVAAAERQVDALTAQRKTAEANLDQAKAQRDQAELNLSYTTVAAAQPGRVVNLSAAVGQFVSAGTAPRRSCPTRSGLPRTSRRRSSDQMRPGEPATIEVDAYPDHPLVGRVASVQPGSGTAFSLLPAENATGNYVKIVQRVPVKIVLADPPSDVALGPGMSVVPTVRVDPAPSLYERLKDRAHQLFARRP